MLLISDTINVNKASKKVPAENNNIKSFDRTDKESEIFIITGWKIKSQSTIKIYMPEP